MEKKVSLVLSGGGARGIAHIGVIEELERQGYTIKSISGTSMGAVVGAVFAVGKLQAYKEWICSLDKMRIFRLVDFTFSSQGLIKGDRVFNKMKEFMPDVNIEDLNINFAATATDIINNKEVVFTKGSIIDALRASVAIPTVFTPVKTKNSILVDGGVINNIPISYVQRTKDDILIVVYVNADVPIYKPQKFIKENDINRSAYLKKIKEFQNHLYKIKLKDKSDKNDKKDNLRYFSIMDKTLSIMRLQLAKLTIEKFNPDILINISRDTCGTFDFYRAEELVEIGRDTTIQTLKDFELRSE